MEAATVTETRPGAGAEIAKLRPGRAFSGRYACVRKDRQTARNGSSYLAVELRDRTGVLPARVFRDADRLGLRFERGDAVAVRGKVDRFRGELSGELDEVRKLGPDEWAPEEFLPVAYRSAEDMNGFLEHLAREIADPKLRAVVEAVVFTGPLAEGFRRAPCTAAGHHAYVGGLLEHTVSVATLAGELCQLHPRVDSDMLMAAAILHDVGKAREFTYGAEFGTTEEGRLLGHLVIGGQIVGEAAQGLPSERRLHLLNCVLSHHGPDAGPARARPAAGGGGGFASAEALALYRLNALDASVKGALEGGRR
ncbi:MAG: 3'-5' exoribonuclease YhaM family protein [Solirubrobacterales bacterium]